MKIRVKQPDDPKVTANLRAEMKGMIEGLGGRDATGPNPRQHVVGIFADKAAAKKFRGDARALVGKSA